MEYFSYVVRHPVTGESLVTEVHEPLDEEHTRLHWLMRVQAPQARAMMADPQHRPMFERRRPLTTGSAVPGGWRPALRRSSAGPPLRGRRQLRLRLRSAHSPPFALTEELAR